MMVPRFCIADGLKNEQAQINKDTSARVGVQVVSTPRKCYGLSVAVWWYIFVRLWLELFVSQGLILGETAASRKA